MRFIFDLDGTLIDSAPAIRRCLEMATATVAPACVFRAMTVPIGPPLARTVESILGETRSALCGELAREFASLYDVAAAENAREFPSTSVALRALAHAGARLSIVTNKRERPTQHILEALGWLDHFDAVLCVDSRGYAGLDKTARVAAVLRNASVEDAASVGDTLEDFRAAAANDVSFVAADYGYEVDRTGFALARTVMRLPTPQDLVRLVTLFSSKQCGASPAASV